MKRPLILINDFKGGVTLNEKLGRADQFHTGYQLDFGTKRGKLAPGPAWTLIKDGSANSYVADEYQGILATQEDDGLYFGADDAKIYKLSASTSIIATSSDQTGTIRGLIEHEGYMYYPQNTTIGQADLAGAYDHDYATGLNSATYHPMHKAADGNVYVGHGNDVGSIIGTTWAADALDLPTGWDIRTLSDFGYLYLAIGADYFGTLTHPQQTKIFLWNRSDATWNDEIVVPEKGIKAMVFDSGYLWIWAGRSCNLYVVPEGSRKVTKVWSFSKENPSDVYEVYPNAVLARNGTIYFGLSGVGTESTDNNPNAIYSFPADPNNFTLNIVYTGDATSAADNRFKSLGLYPASAGDTIYASFFDFNHATAANKNQLKVEDIASAPYNDTAVYESFRYDAPPDKRMKTQNFGVTFDKLPTGTGNYANISLDYKKDDDASWTSVFANYGGSGAGDETMEKIVKKGLYCDSLKLRLSIRGGATSSFSRPFIKSIYVTGSLVAKQK